MVFLFFRNDKGEKNQGPNDDVHGLKYCSSSLATLGYGSLRPPTNESYSKSWAEDMLKEDNSNQKMSFEDY